MDEALRLHSVERCPACGAGGEVLFEALPDPQEGPPGTWRFRRCRRCRSLWLDPRPSEGDLARAYHPSVEVTGDPSVAWGGLRKALRDAVAARAFGYPTPGGSDLIGAAGRLLAGTPMIRDRVGGPMMWLPGRSGGSLLDVGCGDGSFMTRMRSLGWAVTGLDSDPAAVQAARSRGLSVQQGTLDRVEFPEESFDVVTMSHVIEHIPDPTAALTKCGRVLRPGGRLVAVTPNAASLGLRFFGRYWGGLDPPRHLILFTPRALLRCAGRSGIEPTEIRTTSRLAPFLWHASWWLRRGGSLPGDFGVAPGGPARVRALMFWLIDELASRLWGGGEEILLVAEKAQARKTGEP
jgi:2-polyprenyl-3-methyl-5-hydroxy-6-metoxy-1,4-benzoquinol methylase